MMISAELDANIWKVLVTLGDRVAKGDELAILESMKMELPVLCEKEGTITHIYVTEGESVARGQRLIEID